MEPVYEICMILDQTFIWHVILETLNESLLRRNKLAAGLKLIKWCHNNKHAYTNRDESFGLWRYVWLWFHACLFRFKFLIRCNKLIWGISCMIIYVGSLWIQKKIKMKQGRMNSMIVNTHVIIQISKSV